MTGSRRYELDLDHPSRAGRGERRGDRRAHARGLADLEDQWVAVDEVDPDVVSRLSRSAHSLKALAGFFGFDPIRRRAHPLEERVCGGKSASSGLGERRASEE
jgi:chemotaxis protein histidine kinase CheA